MEGLNRILIAISTSAPSLRFRHPSNLSTSHWQPGPAKSISAPNDMPKLGLLLTLGTLEIIYG